MTVYEELAAHALPTARQVIVRSIGRTADLLECLVPASLLMEATCPEQAAIVRKWQPTDIVSLISESMNLVKCLFLAASLLLVSNSHREGALASEFRNTVYPRGC